VHTHKPHGKTKHSQTHWIHLFLHKMGVVGGPILMCCGPSCCRTLVAALDVLCPIISTVTFSIKEHYLTSGREAVHTLFCFLPSFQASTQWRNRADEGHAHAFRLPGVQPCGPQPWPQRWGPQPWGPQQQRQPVRKQERASKTCGTKARTSFKNMRSLLANMSFFALSLQLRRGETDEDRRRKPKISKTRDKGWPKRTVNVCRINFLITWPLRK